MNEDIHEAEGVQPKIGLPISPRKLTQNVGAQVAQLKLTRVNPSFTNSPTKITVIPATMRNAPIRIIPAPNKGVGVPSTQISVPSSVQQRVFTIQTTNAISGMSPVLTAVPSSGQLVTYQNIMKTAPKIQVQGRQVQYLQVLNSAISGTPVSCVATPVSSSTVQQPVKSGSMVQMVVLPPPKQELQVKNKTIVAEKLKPDEVKVSPKEDSKSRVNTLPPEALLPRKPCNCTKSRCLKLYCECFANGEFCYMCKCVSCSNNLEHEEERQKAIKSCLDRNRDAFRPKIGKGLAGDGRRHNRGCQCKRSGCLKNYCECYEAKISCTNMCRCMGCRNTSRSIDDVKEVLKEVVDVKSVQDLSHKLKNKQETPLEKKLNSELVIKKKPQVFMTPSVIEATCQCMVAQVTDAQRRNGYISSTLAERMVLEEFGKCLVHIIESSRNANVSNGKINSFT